MCLIGFEAEIQDSWCVYDVVWCIYLVIKHRGITTGGMGDGDRVYRVHRLRGAHTNVLWRARLGRLHFLTLWEPSRNTDGFSEEVDQDCGVNLPSLDLSAPHLLYLACLWSWHFALAEKEKTWRKSAHFQISLTKEYPEKKRETWSCYFVSRAVEFQTDIECLRSLCPISKSLLGSKTFANARMNTFWMWLEMF